MSAHPDFLAFCAKHGVDPDSLPDRHRRRQPSRRYQRSPNRARSYERRHQLATMLSLPARLAAGLTIADRAVLKVVADEVQACSVCELTNDEIAARAGVCRKSVTRALMYAAGEDTSHDQRAAPGAMRIISIERRRGRGGKNLPNIVRIISPMWLAWLRIGPRKPARTVGQIGPTTEDKGFQKEKEVRDRTLRDRRNRRDHIGDEHCRRIRKRLGGADGR